MKHSSSGRAGAFAIVLAISGAPACDDSETANDPIAGGAIDSAQPDQGPADAAVPDTGAIEAQVFLPADDAVHAEAVEWWYWTGHLSDADGRDYGFQITFFLFGDGAPRATLSNVALTDISADTFEHEANFAFTTPVLLDGAFEFELEGHRATGGGGRDHLIGDVAGAALDLRVSGDHVVLHHDDGHQIYPFGGYTYYYSRPRMQVEGTLTVGEDARAVTGTAWFDHQWGDLTAVTEVGWDWFALQLEDGRNVMLFVTRAPGAEAFVGGTISDGASARHLDASEISVSALGEWTSDETGCTWPSGWTIEVAGEQFTVQPVRPDQEIIDARRIERTYWEGACTVSGDADGRAYVELTGYCGG